MRIKIEQHNAGNPVHVGIVTIDGDYSAAEIAAVANASGGMSDLIAMGDWDGPSGYEWNGDEVYEIAD